MNQISGQGNFMESVVLYKDGFKVIKLFIDTILLTNQFTSCKL